MEDEKIVELYWQRSSEAIAETSRKYGAYCMRISMNILADKSDVRRSRVRNTDISTFDIHDRVNYSVTKSELKINEAHTLIKLKLTVDTHMGSVMDYFEIFMARMILCRKAAEKLGLQFKLMINEQQLI